jgi:hypothetical protein
MTEFNRYVATVRVEQRAAGKVAIDELPCSVAAVSETTARSTVKTQFDSLTYVTDVGIMEIYEQNE